MKQQETYWPTASWRTTVPQTFHMQLEDACFPDLDLIFAMTAQPEVGRPPAHRKIINDGLGPLLEKI